MLQQHALKCIHYTATVYVHYKLKSLQADTNLSGSATVPNIEQYVRFLDKDHKLAMRCLHAYKLPHNISFNFKVFYSV